MVFVFVCFLLLFLLLCFFLFCLFVFFWLFLKGEGVGGLCLFCFLKQNFAFILTIFWNEKTIILYELYRYSLSCTCNRSGLYSRQVNCRNTWQLSGTIKIWIFLWNKKKIAITLELEHKLVFGTFPAFHIKTINISKEITLSTYFMPLVSFYAPWKHKKTKGFFMFSGHIVRDQWHEVG